MPFKPLYDWKPILQLAAKRGATISELAVAKKVTPAAVLKQCRKYDIKLRDGRHVVAKKKGKGLV